jgi:menaquinone-dependent protoporphyrinogen oxidase
MAKILVVYGSRYGQTGKVAVAIAEELRMLGDRVLMVDAEKESPSALHHDAVIVGAPVYNGHYPGPVAAWVRRNARDMAVRPSAFYSVGLGARKKEPAARAEEKARVYRFLARTRWTPQATAEFPGALTYTRYGWLMRKAMKFAAWRSGGDTDTSKDYEYTDWNEVRRFAREFHLSVTEQLAIQT